MSNSEISSTGTILLLSTAASAIAVGISVWMFMSARSDARSRIQQLEELHPIATEIKATQATIDEHQLTIRAADDLRTAIKQSISEAELDLSAVQDLTIASEQPIPQKPFKRRDTELLLRSLSLSQLAKILRNLRLRCPSAAFAEADLEAGEPTAQNTPEQWNARLLLSEFSYSEQ